MWLLMLEAGVALFLLVFIVWWTIPSNKKPAQSEHSKSASSKDEAQP